MVFLLIGFVLMLIGVAAAIWFGWQNKVLREDAARVNDRIDELNRERALRRNLQSICDSRGAELNRLRRSIRRRSENAQASEEEAADLKVRLFEESGQRIRVEKEARDLREKLRLTELQVEEGRKKLTAQRKTEAELREALARANEELTQLKAPKPRKPARKAGDPIEAAQISVTDLLGDD